MPEENNTSYMIWTDIEPYLVVKHNLNIKECADI